MSALASPRSCRFCFKPVKSLQNPAIAISGLSLNSPKGFDSFTGLRTAPFTAKPGIEFGLFLVVVA